MEWDIEYYQKENGEIPVENFLLTLKPKLRAKAFSDIMLLKQLGINIREPYATAIKGDKYKGLFELRAKFLFFARPFCRKLQKLFVGCCTYIL